MERTTADNYIRAIAEHRSISVAAESLGITQPALSAALKKKEKELGAQLFDRSRQPLELTEAGRAYIDYAERAEMLRSEMEKKLADIEGVNTGSLKIGGAVFFNIAYMTNAIASYLEKYPQIQIEVLDRSVPELTTLAAKGDIDAFITPFADEPDRFVYEELADEKIFIAVPSELAINEKLSAKRITDAADRIENMPRLIREEFAELCENTFIVLKSNQSIGQRMEEIFREYGVRPERTLTAEQTMTTLALTNAGVGISLVTESSVRSSGLSSLPAFYLAEGETCSRKIYVAYPKNKYLSRAAEEFIRILKDINSND